MSNPQIHKIFAATRAFEKLAPAEQAAVAEMTTPERKHFSNEWFPTRRELSDAQRCTFVQLLEEIHARRPYLVLSTPLGEDWAAAEVWVNDELKGAFTGFTRGGDRSDGRPFDVVAAVDELEKDLGDAGIEDPNADDPMFSETARWDRMAAEAAAGAFNVEDLQNAQDRQQVSLRLSESKGDTK